MVYATFKYLTLHVSFLCMKWQQRYAPITWQTAQQSHCLNRISSDSDHWAILGTFYEIKAAEAQNSGHATSCSHVCSSLPVQHLTEKHGKASWCLTQLCLKWFFSFFSNTEADSIPRGHKFIFFRNMFVNLLIFQIRNVKHPN